MVGESSCLIANRGRRSRRLPCVCSGEALDPMASSTRHTPVPSALHAAGPRLALIVQVGGASADGADAHDARQRAPHCALWISDVAEVMRPLPIERLGEMPFFVLGLSVIRGVPTPVVDATALLDPHPEGHAPPTRFVVMRLGERRVALAVGAVLGVRFLDGGTLQALPPLLRDASEQLVGALGTLDAQLLTVLQAGYLLPPSSWEALAAARAPA